MNVKFDELLNEIDNVLQKQINLTMHNTLKTSYLDIFNLFIFLSCTMKVTNGSFADLFDELYISAVIMDPFQTFF